MDARTIDWSKTERQDSDPEIIPFSFTTEKISQDLLPCYITYTNEKTHDIIRGGLDRSPMYTGVIEGVGPRYCPSIEDKIHRFSDKVSHQIFIEPEGEHAAAARYQLGRDAHRLEAGAQLLAAVAGVGVRQRGRRLDKSA